MATASLGKMVVEPVTLGACLHVHQSLCLTAAHSAPSESLQRRWGSPRASSTTEWAAWAGLLTRSLLCPAGGRPAEALPPYSGRVSPTTRSPALLKRSGGPTVRSSNGCNEGGPRSRSCPHLGARSAQQRLPAPSASIAVAAWTMESGTGAEHAGPTTHGSAPLARQHAPSLRCRHARYAGLTLTLPTPSARCTWTTTTKRVPQGALCASRAMQGWASSRTTRSCSGRPFSTYPHARGTAPVGVANGR